MYDGPALKILKLSTNYYWFPHYLLFHKNYSLLGKIVEKLTTTGWPHTYSFTWTKGKTVRVWQKNFSVKSNCELFLPHAYSFTGTCIIIVRVKLVREWPACDLNVFGSIVSLLIGILRWGAPTACLHSFSCPFFW